MASAFPQISAKSLKAASLMIQLRPVPLRATSNGSGVLESSMISAPASINPLPVLDFEKSVFKEEKVTLAGRNEFIVSGGIHLLPCVNNAFKGIKQIAVIGSQGLPQAQILRVSLAKANSDIVVKFGAVKSSQLWAEAHAAGFTEESGTLGHIHETVAGSDLLLLQVSCYEQAANYENLFSNMKPNSILGLCNSSLYDQRGLNFPKNISIISVCPKTMGPSIGGPLDQGSNINYDRIYTIFGIHQDVDGRATDVAIGWSVALGSPFTFPTTPRQQFGFRNLEIGVTVESIFRKFIDDGMSEDVAYANTVRYITGDTAMTPAAQALIDLYKKLYPEDKERLVDVVLGNKSIDSMDNKSIDVPPHPRSAAAMDKKISKTRASPPPRSAAAMDKISKTRVSPPPRSAAATDKKSSKPRVPPPPRSAAAAMGKKISKIQVPPPPRSAAAAAMCKKISQTRVPPPLRSAAATTELGTEKMFLVLCGITAEGLRKRRLYKMRPSVRVSLDGVSIETVTACGCNPSFHDTMVFEVGSDTEMKLRVDISSKGWRVGCATKSLEDMKNSFGIMIIPVIRPSGRTRGKVTIPFAFVNAASANAAIAEILTSGNSATCTETFYDCNEEFGSDSESETHSDVVAEIKKWVIKALRIIREWGPLACTVISQAVQS